MHTPHTFTHGMILGHNRNHCQGKSRLSAASLYTRAYAVKVNCKIPDTAAQRAPRRTCCSSFLPFPQPTIHSSIHPSTTTASKASLPRSRSHQRNPRHTMHRRGATTATADPHSPASLYSGWIPSSPPSLVAGSVLGVRSVILLYYSPPCAIHNRSPLFYPTTHHHHSSRICVCGAAAGAAPPGTVTHDKAVQIADFFFSSSSTSFFFVSLSLGL